MLRTRSTGRALVAFALAGTLAAAPTVAAAPAATEDPVELIREGRHLDAAAAFERQYEGTGDGALLFAKATALRRGGDCQGAIDTLERFIDTKPPEPDIAAAREVIGVCTEILSSGEPESPTPPPPVLIESVPEPERAPTRERAWTRDVPGGALLGGGVAVTVGGVVLLGLAVSRSQPREESEAGFERRDQSVLTLSAVGGSMVAAGAALLIGSIVRYAVVARRSERRSTRSTGRVRLR